MLYRVCFEPLLIYTVISLSVVTNIDLTMRTPYYTSSRLKRLSRWLLMLFVLSWLNLAFQVPVHASMMQEKTRMSQMDMDGMNCHCPPAICDVILASDNVSFDSMNLVSLADLTFNAVYIFSIQQDDLSFISNHNFHDYDISFRLHSPPPISLNTTLLI